MTVNCCIFIYHSVMVSNFFFSNFWFIFPTQMYYTVWFSVGCCFHTHPSQEFSLYWFDQFVLVLDSGQVRLLILPNLEPYLLLLEQEMLLEKQKNEIKRHEAWRVYGALTVRLFFSFDFNFCFCITEFTINVALVCTNLAINHSARSWSMYV